MTSFYFEACLFFPIAIFLTLYFYFIRNNNHWKDKNVPFLKPVPFFGNLKDGILMRTSMGEIIADLYRKAKTPIVGFFILDKPCLLIKDVQIIKRIIINDFQYFYDRSVLSNKRDDPISAHILFVLKNPEWKEIRSKVSPFFTTSKMKSMSKLIEAVSNEMIVYLKKRTRNNPVVDMKEVCMRFTVDAITTSAFGVEPDSFKNKNSQFYTAAYKLVEWDNFKTAFQFRCYFLAHSLVKLFRMKFLHSESTKFLRENFLNMLDVRGRSKNFGRNDLVDIIWQLNENDQFFIEKEKLLSQAVMFFLAGFETSSSAIGFGLHELAHHPEIQTRLRDEINKVSEEHEGIHYESLKEMRYLDMCIKEILRKYPVLPFLERKCNTRYTIPETGTVIDKETSVFISNLALHYDPQYFPDPEVFDPERFSQENKHKIENFVYLPFGGGPRNCIGGRFGVMMLKFAFANILRNFSVEPTAETSRIIKLNPNGFVLSASKGINLKLSEIQLPRHSI